MKQTVKLLRKIGVAIVGFPLIISGLILIPLPGPGILIIVAGLFVLAIEFEWAKKHHIRVKKLLKRSIDQFRSKSAKVLLPAGGLATCLMNFLD